MSQGTGTGVDGLLGAGGPPPARRTPRPGRRRPPVGRVLASLLLVVLLVAGVLVGGGLLVAHLLRGGGVADYPGPGSGAAVVHVQPGDTASAVGDELVAAGVVKSRAAFTRAADGDDRSRGLQPGYYRLRLMMSGQQALDLLLTPSARLQTTVTVPEGASTARTLDLLASKGGLSRSALQEALGNPAVLGLPAYAGGKPDGFLFPATYDFAPGTQAVDALRQLTARFAQAAETTDLVAGAKALGLTPREVVTVASLVEREAAAPSDRPQVARVVYNRLKAGMKLGLESTVRFAAGGLDAPRLTQSQLDAAATGPLRAYDTYVVTGLPPGPIDNPGEAALQAALHPAPGDALYFVTLPKSGKTVFTGSFAEFQRLSAQCRAEGGC